MPIIWVPSQISMDGRENDTEFKRSEQKCEKCRGAWMCFLCIACDSQESTALHDAQLHLDASRPQTGSKRDLAIGSFQSMSPISSNIQSIILMQTEHVEISWRAFSDASLSYRQGFCLCHMAASRRRFDVLTHTIAIDCHFHCSCLKEYFAQTAHFEGKQLSKYDKHQNKPKT